MSSGFSHFFRAAFGLNVLGLLSLTVLHLLDIPRGDLIDWTVGVVSVWWLLLVTTVPWNVRFDALAALREGAVAQERGVDVDDAEAARIRMFARWALVIALVLHIVSAVGLYVIAANGWSAVGYPAAALALALTFVRPGIRVYGYFRERLRAFRQEVRYPREDVIELRERVRALEKMLDLSDAAAWASEIQARLREAARKHGALVAQVSGLEDLTDAQFDEVDVRFGEMEASGNAAYARLETEYRSALATVTEDRQFVEHLREIVRFVRRA